MWAFKIFTSSRTDIFNGFYGFFLEKEIKHIEIEKKSESE